MTLSEADNLDGVAAAMADYLIRHVPVVDGKMLVGIVSQRDFLRAAVSSLTRGEALTSLEQDLERRTFVARIMTRNPLTVRAETTLAEAAGLLVDHRVGLLPVVDAAGALVGVVSEIDVLTAAKTVL